jgi:hypothetical protein
MQRVAQVALRANDGSRRELQPRLAGVSSTEKVLRFRLAAGSLLKRHATPDQADVACRLSSTDQ